MKTAERRRERQTSSVVRFREVYTTCRLGLRVVSSSDKDFWHHCHPIRSTLPFLSATTIPHHPLRVLYPLSELLQLESVCI